MIAVDTNLLVYGHREDHEWFGSASDCLRGLAEGVDAWAVPWPCPHEFLAIVTHPRIFVPPTPLELALDQVAAWLESPSLVVLGEARGYWDVFGEIALGHGSPAHSSTMHGWPPCACITAWTNSGPSTATSAGSLRSRCATPWWRRTAGT